jgi:hypothetical protein
MLPYSCLSIIRFALLASGIDALNNTHNLFLKFFLELIGKHPDDTRNFKKLIM